MDSFDLLPSLADGELAESSAAELVAAIYRARASGTLTIDAPEMGEVRQFFRSGQMCGSSYFAGFRTLAQVLLEQEWTQALDVDASLAEAQQQGKRHGEILVEKGLLSREQLTQALGAQHRYNLMALMHLDRGHYEMRGWEPPPVWSRELNIDPVGPLFDSLEEPRLAHRRALILDWLGAQPARLTQDWQEISRKALIAASDHRAISQLSLARTRTEFLAVSRLMPARAEAVLAGLILIGAAEPKQVTAPIRSSLPPPQPYTPPPAYSPPAPAYSQAPPPSYQPRVEQPPAAARSPHAPARESPNFPSRGNSNPRISNPNLQPAQPRVSTPSMPPAQPARPPTRPIHTQPSPRSDPSLRPPRGTAKTSEIFNPFATPPPESSPADDVIIEESLPVGPPEPELQIAAAARSSLPEIPHLSRTGLMLAEEDDGVLPEAQLASNPGVPKPRLRDPFLTPPPADSPEVMIEAQSDELELELAPPRKYAPGVRPSSPGHSARDLEMQLGDAASLDPGPRRKPAPREEEVDVLTDAQAFASPPLAPDPADEERRKKLRARGLRNVAGAAREPQAQEMEGAVEAQQPSRAEPAQLSREAQRFLDEVRSRLRMLPAQSPWQRLGVSRKATNEQIHAAYLDLVKRFHPDAGTALGLDAEDELRTLFGAIKEAHERIGTAAGRERFEAQTSSPGGSPRAEEAALALKMGEVLLKKRDFAGAMIKLRRAAELDPNGDTLAALAWGLLCDPALTPMMRGEAEALIDRALRVGGATARTHYVAGVSWRQRDPAAAERSFRKALELDPNHRAASQELRLLELRQQRNKK